MAGKSPNFIDVAVGRNVRVWRMAKGLSQTQLASRLGVTFQQIQKYEVGADRIGTGRLVEVAAILGHPDRCTVRRHRSGPSRTQRFGIPASSRPLQ
jgi:transcriptional regulator with XRE-family HTH domain